MYGIFDISDGQAQLIGPSKAVKSEVYIHNQIVNYVHDIGISTRDTNNLLNSLGTDLDINILKEEISKLSQEKKSLIDYMGQNSFKRNKQIIEETFENQYLPTVKSYENTYRKLFAYTTAKPLDEISLNSFKEESQKAFEAYTNAHNTFVDELNRVRRY